MARSRAADFEEKQLHILTNAAAVFAELGMEKASMSQVAARSQVSKALLYHYYPSKSALIFDIIRSHLEELDDALEIVAEESKNDAPEVRLRKLVRQILECYRDADDKHLVQLNCQRSLPEDEAQEIHMLERKIVVQIANTILEINPDINAERPLLKPVTMSLFGMLNWVYMWFRPDGPISREEYADLATTLILEGLKNIR
ncbi:TetR/AcrR family transcriptional regulator [Paenalcaligenes suwonensis]|uniref:TetR/AcrR family transcriptional regulator n=1 Tax=Paenalcaligenes suwonensis TaxID=1202713 RepID=UPI00140C77E4|nr:TetR/AcrR family transcriptional regulator [Paenalcaligenes suwonensis]NHC60303.1 TetR/AcrR family transcriptional regulator [Paenalcaligenes suwonensis]